MKTSVNVSGVPNHVGMYAVMRHRSKGSNMKFTSVHQTHALALAEAQRLTAEAISVEGPKQNLCYYVVRIVDRAGIVNGRLESGGQER